MPWGSSINKFALQDYANLQKAIFDAQDQFYDGFRFNDFWQAVKTEEINHDYKAVVRSLSPQFKKLSEGLGISVPDLHRWFYSLFMDRIIEKVSEDGW